MVTGMYTKEFSQIRELFPIREHLFYNKMGNPSNGPAAVIWLNMFCLDGFFGHRCRLVK